MADQRVAARAGRAWTASGSTPPWPGCSASPAPRRPSWSRPAGVSVDGATAAQVRPGARRVAGSRSSCPGPPAPRRSSPSRSPGCGSCTTTTTSWWSTSRSASPPTRARAGPARPCSAGWPRPATGSPPPAPPSGRASCTGWTSARAGLMVVAKSERAVHRAQAGLQGAHGRQDLPRAGPGPPGPDAAARSTPRSAGTRSTTTAGPSSPAASRASPTTRRSRRSGAASLLEIHLETGRTHQIRVHFSALRHPCVGDLTYGADPTLAARLGLDRQWLHAVRLGFEHPGTGRPAGAHQPLPGRTCSTRWTSSPPAEPGGRPAWSADGRGRRHAVRLDRGAGCRRLSSRRPRLGACRRSSTRPARPTVRGRRRPRSSTCTCTPSTRCSTARPGSTTCSPRPRAQGMPAIATTDHGYVFGAYEFWKAGRRHGVKPIIGIEAYLTPGTSRFDRSRVKWGDGGRDDVSGGGAYTHMTLLARDDRRACTTCSGWRSLASLEGHYFKPRMDRELLHDATRDGLIATTGCPSGEVQTRLRLGQYDEARQAAADFRDIFGAENYYCELMDHGLGIERQVQRGPAAARQGPAPAAGRHQRPALHPRRGRQGARGAAVRAVRLDPGRPEPVQVRRRRASTSRPPAEMRHALARAARGLRQHPGSSPSAARSRSPRARAATCRASRCPPGENEESWFVKEVERGLRRRYPGGVPDDARKQADVRDRGHRRQGLPGLLPGRRRLHQLGQGQRHPGRPGPRLGRRLDGRLRHGDHRPRPAASTA